MESVWELYDPRSEEPAAIGAVGLTELFMEGELPSLQELYEKRCVVKVQYIYRSTDTIKCFEVRILLNVLA